VFISYEIAVISKNVIGIQKKAIAMKVMY
jgi:hypothetical protein